MLVHGPFDGHVDSINVVVVVKRCLPLLAMGREGAAGAEATAVVRRGGLITSNPSKLSVRSSSRFPWNMALSGFGIKTVMVFK